jgi:hypothetical protein
MAIYACALFCCERLIISAIFYSRAISADQIVMISGMECFNPLHEQKGLEIWIAILEALILQFQAFIFGC